MSFKKGTKQSFALQYRQTPTQRRTM